MQKKLPGGGANGKNGHPLAFNLLCVTDGFGTANLQRTPIILSQPVVILSPGTNLYFSFLDANLT